MLLGRERIIWVAADGLVCERRCGGPEHGPCEGEPEVRPRPGDERGRERAGRVHRRAGDRSCEECVEADGGADSDRPSRADGARVGRDGDDHEHQERGQQELVDERAAGSDRGDGRPERRGVTLSWDDEAARVHAELVQVGAEWTLVDDGLSLNGSFVNGTIVQSRRRLHDGDTLRIGNTLLLFRDPGEADSRATIPSAQQERAASLSDGQRRVLISLCRPFKASTAFVTPATNEQIAGELFLSVDAVKKHMRALFEKFGVEHLPQGEKRARLVERAFASGAVTERDLA